MRTIERQRDIARVLSRAADSSEAIRSLYELLKTDDRKMSVAYLCSRAGIPSKGSLADAMSGRRKLKLEYAKGLAKAFGLPRFEAKVLVALIALEHAKKPAEREKLEKDLATWRKSLAVERRSVDATVASPRWLAKIFTTLSLLPERVPFGDLREKLARHSEPDIKFGLHQLVTMGLVKFDGNTIERGQTQIVFQPADLNSFQIEFLRDSMKEASEQAAHWYKNGASSFFESTLLTVKKEAFLAKLPEIKDFFERLQSELESEEGDELVSLNVQIYPTK